MTSNTAYSSGLSSEPSELIPVVQQYQRIYLAWADEHSSERKAMLRAELALCQEALWDLLADPLKSVASRWIQNSGVGREIRANVANGHYQQDALESLAMHLYWPILEALPKLQIDPEKNLLACLKKIAQCGISKENQRIYTASPRQARKSTREVAPESGTPEAAMWLMNGDHFEDTEDIADSATYDLEDQIVRAIDKQRCWQEVQVFWQHDLAQDDRKIITIRWKTNPPAEFKAVAQDMGAGWTEEAVRQRHSRIMRRTREYLQERGFA